MSEVQKSPLLVEVILRGGQMVRGVTTLVSGRRRLVDLLNSPEEMFQLESVTLTPPPSAPPPQGSEDPRRRHFASLVIEKEAIHLAIPLETPEQLRARAVLATIVGRLATVPAALTVLLPPLIIEGVGHLPPGFGQVRADPEMFQRFFPLTDARLVMSDGSVRAGLPIVLLNRDHVAAMSLRERTARPSVQPAQRAAVQDAPTEEEVPWLHVQRPSRRLSL